MTELWRSILRGGRPAEARSAAPRRREPPIAPASAPESVPMGPGAMIGGGGGYSLTKEERDAGDRYSSSIRGLGRQSSDAPVTPLTNRNTPEFPVGPGGVVSPSPLQMAVDATGAPESYMSALIVHESGGRADARAESSSATGHFQFIDGTWLDVMRRYGGRYGAAGQEMASAITRRADGSSTVSDPAMRERILAAREDPRWAALLGGHLTQENASALRAALGRPVTEGEVYLTHFLGPSDGTALVRAVTATERGRNRPASDFVSGEAVDANPTIFWVDDGRNRARFNRVPNGRGGTKLVYAGGGRRATAAEVYARQTHRFRDGERHRPYRGR